MISIVIPVYNIEKYLSECIESVLQQGDKDIEIILVDDGSTDSSGKICDEYSFKDSRIRVVHKENGGLVKARLTGVEQAKGDYIISLDGDDVIYPGLISHVDNIICSYQPDIVCFDLLEFGICNPKSRRNCYKEGLYTGEKYLNIIKTYICDENKPFFTAGLVYGIVTKVVKRNLLLKALDEVPQMISLGEDLATTSIVLSDAKNLYITHFDGYGYRQVFNSISHKYSDTSIVELKTLIDLLKKSFVKSKNKVIPEGQLEKYVSFRVIKLFSEIACIDSISNAFGEMNKIDQELFLYIKNTDTSWMSLTDKTKIGLLKTRFRGVLLLAFRLKYRRKN